MARDGGLYNIVSSAWHMLLAGIWTAVGAPGVLQIFARTVGGDLLMPNLSTSDAVHGGLLWSWDGAAGAWSVRIPWSELPAGCSQTGDFGAAGIFDGEYYFSGADAAGGLVYRLGGASDLEVAAATPNNLQNQYIASGSDLYVLTSNGSPALLSKFISVPDAADNSLFNFGGM